MRCLIGSLAFAFALAGPAAGQDQSSGAAFNVDVPVGFAGVWIAPKAFRDVVVGDDTTLGVSPLTDRSVTITARKVGQSNLLFLDADHMPVANLTVSVLGASPQLIRMHSKPNTHEYYAYVCSPTGCVRSEDSKEGPVPEPPVTNNTIERQTIIYGRPPAP